MLNLINRYHKSLLLKITRISKAQTKIPLTPTIEKTWCGQERKIRAIFSPYRYEVDETRQIARKNSKNNPIVVKSVLDSNWKRFRDTAIGETFNWKPEIQMKKNSFQYLRQLYPSIQWSKREAVASYFHLCLNIICAFGQRHVCNSKSSSFF